MVAVVFGLIACGFLELWIGSGNQPDSDLLIDGELVTLLRCDQLGADVIGSRGTHMIAKGFRPFLVDPVRVITSAKQFEGFESGERLSAVPGVPGLMLGRDVAQTTNGSKFQFGSVNKVVVAEERALIYAEQKVFVCDSETCNGGTPETDKAGSVPIGQGIRLIGSTGAEINAFIEVHWNGLVFRGGNDETSAIVWEKVGEEWVKIFRFQPPNLDTCGFLDMECTTRRAVLGTLCPLPNNGVAVIVAVGQPNYTNYLWLVADSRSAANR